MIVRLISDMLQILGVAGGGIALMLHVHGVLNFRPHADRVLEQVRFEYAEHLDNACSSHLKTTHPTELAQRQRLAEKLAQLEEMIKELRSCYSPGVTNVSLVADLDKERRELEIQEQALSRQLDAAFATHESHRLVEPLLPMDLLGEERAQVADSIAHVTKLYRRLDANDG